MRKKKSKILEAVHETAKGLHAAGAIDQVTMRRFDRLCLPTRDWPCRQRTGVKPLKLLRKGPKRSRRRLHHSAADERVFASPCFV